MHRACAWCERCVCAGCLVFDALHRHGQRQGVGSGENRVLRLGALTHPGLRGRFTGHRQECRAQGRAPCIFNRTTLRHAPHMARHECTRHRMPADGIAHQQMTPHNTWHAMTSLASHITSHRSSHHIARAQHHTYHRIMRLQLYATSRHVVRQQCHPLRRDQARACLEPGEKKPSSLQDRGVSMWRIAQNHTLTASSSDPGQTGSWQECVRFPEASRQC